MIENKYNCSPALWRKFTNSAKELYNTLRDEMDLEMILPTGMSDITDEDWDVISHNVAVLAALNRPSKKRELELWNYLKKKLKGLKDNNLTAREIFERITQ